MKKKKVWKHKKYGSRTYDGNYLYVDGEREFNLFGKMKNGQWHRVVFESFEAAKKIGWFTV